MGSHSGKTPINFIEQSALKNCKYCSSLFCKVSIDPMLNLYFHWSTCGESHLPLCNLLICKKALKR